MTESKEKSTKSEKVEKNETTDSAVKKTKPRITTKKHADEAAGEEVRSEEIATETAVTEASAGEAEVESVSKPDYRSTVLNEDFDWEANSIILLSADSPLMSLIMTAPASIALLATSDL